jgi:O-antigen/teichoic acid export membrane protein
MVIWITLLFSPMAFISFLFPEIIIDLLGGGSFTQSYLVLQVFAFAMILLPADKYFGVAFDSINQPGKNASKVWLMVGINIIGDVLVIRLTGQLWMVALITIINIAFGILYGILNNIYIKSQPLKYRISQA